MNKKHINALAESIVSQSVAPLFSLKFSERVEKFLLPGFNELNDILFARKTLPCELRIEISKENHNDIMKDLAFCSFMTGLRETGYSVEELKMALGNIKYLKHK